MSFYPREVFVPIIELSLRLLSIIEEATSLQIVVIDDVFDFFGLTIGEKTLIITLEEIK